MVAIVPAEIRCGRRRCHDAVVMSGRGVEWCRECASQKCSVPGRPVGRCLLSVVQHTCRQGTKMSGIKVVNSVPKSLATTSTPHESPTPNQTIGPLDEVSHVPGYVDRGALAPQRAHAAIVEPCYLLSSTALPAVAGVCHKSYRSRWEGRSDALGWGREWW
jgi:hypothetical protein